MTAIYPEPLSKWFKAIPISTLYIQLVSLPFLLALLLVIIVDVLCIYLCYFAFPMRSHYIYWRLETTRNRYYLAQPSENFMPHSERYFFFVLSVKISIFYFVISNLPYAIASSVIFHTFTFVVIGTFRYVSYCKVNRYWYVIFRIFFS